VKDNLPNGQSYLCGQANEPLLYETIGACLERIASTYPQQPALVVRHQNIRWTYADYQQRIDAPGDWFARHGRQPG
jgi:fatty-acyl-CoA synthase